MDMDDYESLPPATPLAVSCTAGAFAGVAEHCTMYPVDSIKTRMQSLSCSKQRSMNMRQMLGSMIQEEGVRRPWRGMFAMAAGAGPAHAMYFTCLELGKDYVQKFGLSNGSEVVVDVVSAGFATVCHDAVMTPAEVVKQRMQMCCSPFSGCTNAAINIYQTEGLKAFYRSYLTQLTMNVPFQASLVTTYMSIQRFMNPNNEYNPSIHFIAGALAGGVASTVTMPFDNCKTLLNTQEAGVLKKIEVNEINGLVGAARSIRTMVGLRGFFSGLTARILYQAPSTAISWSVYEFIKYFMKKSQPDSDYDTIDTLKEQKCDAVTNKADSKNFDSEVPRSDIDSFVDHSLKDEFSVGSSVSHTISLASDNALLLPRYIKNSTSSTAGDDCKNRNLGYS